jgi:hypothetical protein
MKQWEYSILTINTEYEIAHDMSIENSRPGEVIIHSQLKEAGLHGWELASVLPAMPAKHFKGESPNPWVHWFILKRPIEP